jgi:hypothetical protein
MGANMRLAEGVTAARASGLIQRHAVFPAFPATTPGKSSGIVARPPAAFGSCNAASPRSQEVWASTWPSCATSTLSHLLAVTRLWERWKARLGLSRRPPFGVDSSQSSDASSLASSFSTRWPTSLQATKTPARGAPVHRHLARPCGRRSVAKFSFDGPMDASPSMRPLAVLIGSQLRRRQSGTKLGVGFAIGYGKRLEQRGQADDGGEVDGLGRDETC